MNFATPSRFHQICFRLGVPDEIAKIVHTELVSYYAEDHRKYHNLSHIDRMLGWLDRTGQSIDPVELAIWFHDAIYNPLGNDNEKLSVSYFSEQLGPYISSQLANDVERLILATDASRSRTGNDDENLIIDIDLSILGASPEDYTAYRESIRNEYSAVPEVKFIAGRRSILKHFLSQRIYSTAYFEKLEQQARVNIQQELELLDADEC